jgi:hypothetical protein
VNTLTQKKTPEDLCICSFMWDWLYKRGIVLEHQQQLSIMHRVFEFDDIIYAVLQHVKSSATDLVNVAMTCSRLADSALNILWFEQSSLAPLIMCLPQDTWEITENGVDHTVVSEV